MFNFQKVTTCGKKLFNGSNYAIFLVVSVGELSRKNMNHILTHEKITYCCYGYMINWLFMANKYLYIKAKWCGIS